MKKILIGSNKNINRKIKNGIIIISDIIQYKEGIIEILELNNDINYILFYDNLIGQIKNEELIEKIFKINNNIIVFIIVENKKKFIRNNSNIIKNKNIKIIEKIYDNKLNEIFEEENEDYINNIKNNKIITTNKNDKNKKSYIISISGTSGVGKSVTTLRIAKYLERKNKKILVIDLDYINKSIKLILGKKETDQDIIKINKKIDLIEYKLNMNILEIIKRYQQEYDYILIDISAEIMFEQNKEILKTCDKNIFLIEPNLLGIKKANTLLNIYIDQWKIQIKKINIVCNKYNKYSIKYEIIKNIFYKFKIIGKITLNERYDLLINKNNLKYILIKDNKNYYKRLIQKISRKIRKIKGEKIIWN